MPIDLIGVYSSLLKPKPFLLSRKWAMDTFMELSEKSKLRNFLRHQRDQYAQTHDIKASSQEVLNNLIAAAIVPPGVVIGGYWPTKSEVDVRLFLSYFLNHGHVWALPVVQAPDKSVVFRQWRPGNLLVSGAYNILTPDETAPLVIPTILLVPMMGFDPQGYRLGQGGGYFDRTIADLRAHHSIRVIGIAFDCQEVESIPRQDHDERMDYIITPTRIMEIKT